MWRPLVAAERRLNTRWVWPCVLQGCCLPQALSLFGDGDCLREVERMSPGPGSLWHHRTKTGGNRRRTLGKSKRQMQKIHLFCPALDMEIWGFLICPNTQAFLRRGASSLLPGPGSDLTLA